jgi:hypothetical protein
LSCAIGLHPIRRCKLLVLVFTRKPNPAAAEKALAGFDAAAHS